MLQVFCDFDGTITDRDSIVFLTERFGAGSDFRQRIFDEIVNGRITVFQAIERELETVKISWPQAKAALVTEISVDPTFEGFVHWCQRRRIPVSVVSSGLEPVVELFLGKLGIPLHAHPVQVRETGWRYRRRRDRDKTVLLKEAAGKGRIVYVGDGASDLKVVPLVDVLFATRYLAEYCRQHAIPYFPFNSFADVQSRLELLAKEGS